MNLSLVRRNVPVHAPPDHAMMLAALSTFRQEWDVAAEGESLVRVNASVGLMLLDLTASLGLTPNEQKVVLGSRLYREATSAG